MGINAFSQPLQPARFNPLSFQELSFAPIALRERHDAMLNAQDELLNQLNNIEIPNEYFTEIEAERQGFRDEISKMADRINSKGVGNLSIMSDFRNLRNKYNKAVSLTGNIGRAAKLNQVLKATQDQYTKFGMQQGQSPENIQMNWQKELQNYLGQLPKQLSQHQGQLPDFNPTYAPKYLDLAQHSKQYADLMGKIEDSWGRVRMEPNFAEDPTTREKRLLNYTVYNEQGQVISNDENINRLNELIKQDVLDPSSLLNQNLRYRGINPTDYLSRIDTISDMMKVNSTRNSVSYAGQTGKLFDTDPSKTKTDKDDKAKVRLVSGEGQGIERLVNSNSPTVTRQAIAEISANPDMPEEEKRGLVTAMNYALMLKEKAESSPEFLKMANTAIANNQDILGSFAYNFQGEKKWGIKSYSDYLNLIEDRSNYAIPKMSAYGIEYEVGENLSQARRAMQTMQDILPDSAKEMLIPSKLYTFGVGTEDTKMRDMMSKGMSKQHLMMMAGANNLLIRNPEGTFDEFGPRGNFEQWDSFQKALETATSEDDLKFYFQGLDTGHVGRAPSAIYAVEIKDKGALKFKATMAMELDKQNEIADSLFEQGPGTLYNSLDTSGQLVIDQMQSNRKYFGAPVTFGEANFTETNAELVKGYSSTKWGERNIYPKTKEDNFNKWLFVKQDDTSRYSIQVNENGSYTTYRKDENGTQYKRFVDLYNEEMANEWVNLRNGQPIGALSNTDDATENWKDLYKEHFMLDILLPGLSTFDEVDKFAPYYSSSPIFRERMKELYLLKQEPGGRRNPALIQQAIRVFNDIKELPLEARTIEGAL